MPTIPQTACEPAFADFKAFGNKSLARMLSEARAFCEEMSQNKKPARWLSLVGKSGTGKTHLAKSITRFFKEHLESRLIPGQDPLRTRNLVRGGFMRWYRVADYLRSGDYGVVRDLSEDWFVALDDIGIEHQAKSGFVESKLAELFDARLGKWTVITSNLGVEGIAELSARCASRMRRAGNVLIEVPPGVPDYNTRSGL